MTQRRRRTYIERRIDEAAQIETAVLLLTMRITQAQSTAQGAYTWLDETQAHTHGCTLLSVN